MIFEGLYTLSDRGTHLGGATPARAVSRKYSNARGSFRNGFAVSSEG